MAVGQDGTIRVWNRQGLVVDEWRATIGQIMDVGFLPGGDRVLSMGDDGTLRVSHVLSASAWNGHGVEAVEFDPSQQLLAGGGEDGFVRVWNAATHRRLKKLAGKPGYTDATFSPHGGTLLINRSGDGTVRAWRVGGARQTVLIHTDEDLNTVEFDRPGNLIVWTTAKHVYVRDLRPGGRDTALGGVGDDDMTDARISPDGTQVAAAGTSGVIKLWHRDRPARPYAVLRGHQGAINTIAWSPKGDRIVSAGEDLTVRVWTVSDGSQVVLRGHTLATTSAVFTPDGTHVVSASKDGTVRLWDARGDRPSVVLETRPVGVLDATLAPDGRTIASTGVDGTIHMYTCEVCGSSAKVLQLARMRAG
jgi:WD40 repeat protein